MQQTSILAYKEAKQNIGVKQQQVLSAIKVAKRPICNQEIAEYLRKPINTITPRTNELVSMDRVEMAFKAKYPPTGRLVMYWRVKEN